jgi:hypothetical protein
MSRGMKASKSYKLWTSITLLLALMGASGLLYSIRCNHPMLFQHGNPEVAPSRAFVVMNPFRYRRPEEVAEQLISDLQTNRCESILHDLHSEDARICPLLRNDVAHRLIWRRDDEFQRELAYKRGDSILWIYSSRDEAGFGVTHISLIR